MAMVAVTHQQLVDKLTKDLGYSEAAAKRCSKGRCLNSLLMNDDTYWLSMTMGAMRALLFLASCTPTISVSLVKGDLAYTFARIMRYTGSNWHEINEAAAARLKLATTEREVLVKTINTITKEYRLITEPVLMVYGAGTPAQSVLQSQPPGRHW